MISFSSSFKSFFKIVFSFLVIASLFLQCGGGDDDPAPIVGPVKPCSTCTFVIAGDEHTLTIDGAVLGVQPGDTICLDAAARYGGAFIFTNIVGTEAKPVIITNCGGTVNLKVSKPWNFKTQYSKYFRFTGGDTDGYYGIRMTGSTGSALVLTDLSTNFEVDHVEVYSVGFAGIMAKTDPSCDSKTVRGNFTMRDVALHHNYIHDTDGEGFYIGHSSYGGADVEGCGVRLPHTIEGINIYSNYILRSGWDGIQLSCATEAAAIFDNVIENYATHNEPAQQNGIIIGGGSAADCYRNFINTGTGNGITCFGLGSNVIHDNIILYSGLKGIFCDERASNGDGVKILNNTVINPKQVGIAIYTETLPHNVCINNIVVNPGLFKEYAEGAFLQIDKDVPVAKANNFTTLNINDIKFVDIKKNNFRHQSSSPAVNQGADISTYNIQFDFYKEGRKKGSAYDIGASEFSE
jgi:hypothetical protein